MRSEFNISCGRGQGVLVASPLQEVWVTKCGGSEWVWFQNWLCAWRCKDWHGLHESSYCYFKVYAGTCNLNVTAIIWKHHILTAHLLKPTVSTSPWTIVLVTHHRLTCRPAWHEWWGWPPSAPDDLSSEQSTNRGPTENIKSLKCKPSPTHVIIRQNHSLGA